MTKRNALPALPTREEILSLVAYRQETGEFIWVVNGRNMSVGQRAGHVGKSGYRTLKIGGAEVYAHRVAWFLEHGNWPRLIRFQDKNRDNCAIANLAEGRYLTTKHDHRTKDGKSAYQKEYRGQFRHLFVAGERERRYGVTLRQYEAMFLAQNGKCAVCDQPETATRGGKPISLAVDHNHSTGAVRGLLCRECNTGIGKLRENRGILLSALRYLDKHEGGDVNVVAIRKIAGGA